MKLKSIDDFTLTECQEFLETNPNGEFAQQVIQRMKYLQQLKDWELQQNNYRKINEFNAEFNRHCATQRYEDAFAVCLKYVNNVDNKTAVLEKAKSIIPKLKNRIKLPSSVAISYDWLIDQLVLNGYDKMRYDENSLRWQKSKVIIKTDKTSEIISKCRTNLAIQIICLPLLIFVTFFIFMLAISIGSELEKFGHETLTISLMGIIGIVCSSVFLLWWLRAYIKMHKEPRLLLRRIANIIIENLAKQ